jgi:hypothetical protein
VSGKFKPALAGFVLTSLWFQPQAIPIHNNLCCAEDEKYFTRIDSNKPMYPGRSGTATDFNPWLQS